MNTRALIVLFCCVVTVCGVENKSENVRDKRTLHIVLQAFADSLGYDIQKRPPAPPNAIPKPAGGRSPVNPPLVPPMMPPPKGPTIPMMPAPKVPAPPMMPMPMAPPMPPPKAPMPAPKAPAVPMMPTMAAAVPAKPAPAPPKPTGTRLPTVPPLLTETIQKMFNINFNWNRNLQTPPPNTPKAPAPPMTQAPAPAPAPKSPAPAPKPAPAPSQSPVPTPQAPAPKAPAPAPSAPAPSPSAAAPAPQAPATTTGPVKHVLYSYDYDDGQVAYPQNLKEYDNYYQYDNAEYQQPQQQQAEEEVKQSSDESEAQSKEADIQKVEDTKEQQQQQQVYGDVVQNYWQTSPWNHNQQENQQEESRIPQFENKDFGGHSFVVNHPGGNSYSRMELKKSVPSKQQNFEAPIYYYEEQQQPPLETRNHQLDQQNYHFQGPSFDQYFYTGNGEQNTGKTNAEINSREENGAKQSAESRQKETISPEASLPLPAHNIYQENPYLQWISPFEASSEVKEKKIKATNIKQQQNIKPNPTGSPYGPYAFNYEPDHYNSDFTLHTIPPPSQEDYSKYEPTAFKLEDELSGKAQIKEQQYGRKYTSVHADNLVHRTVG